jgi:hypothetical protein
MDDAGIVKQIVVFDQSERVLDAAQYELWIAAFRRPHPKPVNLSAR